MGCILPRIGDDAALCPVEFSWVCVMWTPLESAYGKKKDNKSLQMKQKEKYLFKKQTA